MKVSVDTCRGLWLLLNAVWCLGPLKNCLRLLRESQARGRADLICGDRSHVVNWVQSVRRWRTDWVKETFTLGEVTR